MFQHILIPTDGSPAAMPALLSAIALARSCGARITALHVVPEFHVLSHDTEMLEATRAANEACRDQGGEARLLRAFRQE